MVGLKTQENIQFEKFFELVQEKAKEDNCVFYLESEDGNDSTFDEMEICDLWGWKIPTDKAKEFEKIWLKDEVYDDWIDYFLAVEWDISNNKVDIRFVNYEYYLRHS